MNRLAAFLLVAFLAGAVAAAPAPVPRPWVSGWDKPVDPVGACRFDRTGDKLTITVPAPDQIRHGEESYLKAPRLLRDVSGDFAAEVRVGGVFPPIAGTGPSGIWGAGIILTDGKRFVLLKRVAIVFQGGEASSASRRRKSTSRLCNGGASA